MRALTRLRRRKPRPPRTPSLRQLEKMSRDRDMARHVPDLRARAARYGLREVDEPDMWKLVYAVHRHEDKLRRPELVAEAKKLGLATWGTVADIALRIYAEQDRRRLLREFGFEK